MTILPLLLQISFATGILFYFISAVLCAYLALITTSTGTFGTLPFKGKFIQTYGYLNIVFWTAVTMVLVLTKLGSLLIG